MGLRKFGRIGNGKSASRQESNADEMRVYQDLSGSDQSRYLQKVSQFRMMNLPGPREK